MKIIKLGKINDTWCHAVEVDNNYIHVYEHDFEYISPDVKIYFDSGVYPSITDIDQYMCDKAWEMSNNEHL